MSTSEREITFGEAVREAISEEMRRDETVFFMGEDVAVAGGVFKVTAGLYEEFGSKRIRDTPISEAGIMGVGVGAALTGMRPVVEIMFGDFMTIAMDQVVNQAAKLCYMTGGQARVPLTIRTTIGAGRSSAAQHSQSLHAWMAHIPGVKVLIPSTPADLKGMLKSAIRDDNPVIIYEDKMMYSLKGMVPEGDDHLVPIGKADIKREGTDVTIVATSSMVQLALSAADTLEQEGISVEVVDPRTLSPLDTDTILQSVRKTSRAIVIDEGYRSYGVTGEIASLIADEAFDYLDAPVKRLGAMDVPVPFSPSLEPSTIPNEAAIISAVHSMYRDVA
ncbi:MAG: alpha-ketoacid dehydrogenase subunit beta [Candidatus Latescibacteria bacterium]|jgi:acetoin:2,6-dichlorophenolindophenol oxidoreductase subunit beta|nr:alpha-ketoacid dehydrogenase subunit beta [Candidatus Latescibacterota bacterium]